MWSHFTKTEQRIILFIAMLLGLGLIANYVTDSIRLNHGIIVKNAVPAEPEQVKTQPVGKVVDLNTASIDVLDTLPGIGKAKAQAIVAWREKNGGFKTVADLDSVPGFGIKTLERLSPLLTVSPMSGSLTSATVGSMASGTTGSLTINHAASEGQPAAKTKVNINLAGTRELSGLKGIGEAKARRIVEFRQKNGPFVSPHDLQKVDGIGEKILQDNFDSITVN